MYRYICEIYIQIYIYIYIHTCAHICIYTHTFMHAPCGGSREDDEAGRLRQVPRVGWWALKSLIRGLIWNYEVL